MARLTPFLLIAAVAGCTAPPNIPGVTAPEAEVAAIPVVPPEVTPFLPPGTPGSVVFQDAAGCYLYSIERTDPPSGFPVRDAAGRQVCEGQPTTLIAPTAPPLAAPLSTAPAPAPVQPLSTVPAPSGATGDLLLGDTPLADIPAPAPLPQPLPTPSE